MYSKWESGTLILEVSLTGCMTLEIIIIKHHKVAQKVKVFAAKPNLSLSSRTHKVE